MGILTGLVTLLGELTVGLVVMAAGGVLSTEGLVMGELVTRGLVACGLVTDDGVDTAGGLAGELGNISRYVSSLLQASCDSLADF